MTYGIGRVPADVDPNDEIIARIEAERMQPTQRRIQAGETIAPTGTTDGIYTPGERCERCGREANWNCGAGEYLCERHWDSY